MNPAIIIPARLGSTRLKRKLLLPINGRPLLWHTWTTAKKLGCSVLIATDSSEIQDEAISWGAKVIHTSSSHFNGTSRLAEVSRKYSYDPIVNLQGDHPNTPITVLSLMLTFLREHPNFRVVTLAQSCDQNELSRSEIVKVVVSKDRALYFSRALLPGAFKHVGVYLYSRSFLLEYGTPAPTPLSELEGLEQLSFLEMGELIGVVKIPSKYNIFSIDTQGDYERYCNYERGGV